MIRRFLITATLIVGVGAPLWAIERATFVMTNGERKSGTVVFHGSQGNNVIDDQFNLGLGDREESYPASQVAVVDFVGGDPGNKELSALSDDRNTIVFRNGQIQKGRFRNLVNGQTVAWENEAGAQVNFPITDVSRIYLIPSRARVVYGYSGNDGGAVAASPPGAIRVNGNTPWVDTGITVRRFEKIAFNATGDVNAAPGASAGPAGTDVLKGNYPVNTIAAAGLIGRIDNGKPFAIGPNTQPILMPTGGRLMLGINDDYFGDNDGYFTVTITRR